MKEDSTRDKWICHGYDGEGCDFEFTNEEWYATFKTIGNVDGKLKFHIDGTP
jgi:hypothetical protein